MTGLAEQLAPHPICAQIAMLEMSFLALAGTGRENGGTETYLLLLLPAIRDSISPVGNPAEPPDTEANTAAEVAVAKACLRYFQLMPKDADNEAVLTRTKQTLFFTIGHSGMFATGDEYAHIVAGLLEIQNDHLVGSNRQHYLEAYRALCGSVSSIEQVSLALKTAAEHLPREGSDGHGAIRAIAHGWVNSGTLLELARSLRVLSLMKLMRLATTVDFLTDEAERLLSEETAKLEAEARAIGEHLAEWGDGSREMIVSFPRNDRAVLVTIRCGYRCHQFNRAAFETAVSYRDRCSVRSRVALRFEFCSEPLSEVFDETRN